MNRLTDIKEKLLLTGGLLLAVALMYVTGVGCIIKRVTGIPCPGCGMTRALSAALRFDFRTAFSYHAMFWALPLMYLFLIYDLSPFRSRLLNRLCGGVLIAGFFGNWLWHLFFGPAL